jgi:hypothetical protein
VKENYPPVNAYQILHSPTIGFNNIDGLELGWKFKGSFLDYSKHLNLSLNCGLLNFLPDWSLGYSNSLSKISPSAFWGISAFDINGYQGGDLALWWNYKPTYEGDPVSGVKLAFQHRRNYDSGYPLLTTAWDKM